MFATSPRRELLEAARFTATHAGMVMDEPGSLRWLIIGAVLMAQNACVAALEGAGAGAAAARRAGLWEAKRAGDAPGQLVSLLELLARAADPGIVPQPHTLPLTIADRGAFERLMALRNQFLHLPPGGLVFEPSETPPLIDAACRAVMHLAVVQPTFAAPGWAASTGPLGADLAFIRDAMEFLRTV